MLGYSMTSSSFQRLVSRIRRDKGAEHVPDFDPDGGSEASRFLFLLEAPGPKSLPGKGSGRISIDNKDGTAKRFKEQLSSCGFKKSEIVVWNIVPWYLGDHKGIASASARDIKEAVSYLDELLSIMIDLEYVILVGQKARDSLVYLSSHDRFTIVGLHHPSNQSFRIDRRQQFTDENIAVLKRIKNAAQQTAPPNGGPAGPLGNSGVSGGPPSVS